MRAATPAFASIPVEADEDDFEVEVAFSYVPAEDDGSAMLVLEGTFSGIAVESFTVYSNFESSDAYEGLEISVEDLSTLLATSFA